MISQNKSADIERKACTVCSIPDMGINIIINKVKLAIVSDIYNIKSIILDAKIRHTVMDHVIIDINMDGSYMGGGYPLVLTFLANYLIKKLFLKCCLILPLSLFIQ